VFPLCFIGAAEINSTDAGLKGQVYCQFWSLDVPMYTIDRVGNFCGF
jgi:hypothetical protein